MNPQADMVVRRITMVATITASYFLLTADYGTEPTVLDPIKKRLLSAENTVKKYIFGPQKEAQENQMEKLDNNKEHP
ncbi:hypothetical protein VNO78_15318 [Psophocarpus tetragonolobus]|uniref:Uncharacterized protein n=1 Tax=Psophocarpus tetragonolobus TaxID=3891 RepID=A0AAN9SDX6_PSOTE